MFELFLEKVMKRRNGIIRTPEDRLYVHNLGIVRLASYVVIAVSLYWLVADLVLNTYNLVLTAKIGVILQLLSSVYMIFLPKLGKKYGFKPVRVSYLVFYAILIGGVSVLTITRNMEIQASGDVSPYVGVSVSTFYLFILAFMPMPKLTDNLIVIAYMFVCLLTPDLMIRTSSYSLLSHIVLCCGFGFATFFFRKVLLRSAEHELEIEKLSDELFNYSITDALTSCLNRRAMDTYIQHLQEKGDVSRIGVMFFDVDYFKKYNDYYGHVNGDEVLRQIARVTQEKVAELGNGYVFRYGGEEFIAILENVDELELAGAMEEVREAVYRAKIERRDIATFDRVTVTMGGAVEAMPNSTGDYVIKADNQLYLGKNSFRNAIYISGKRIMDEKSVSHSVSDKTISHQIGDINEAIASDLTDIYCLNVYTRKMTVYRKGGETLGLNPDKTDGMDYDSMLEDYVSNDVLPSDQAMLRENMKYEELVRQLRKTKTVSFYYRVSRGGVLHHVQLRCKRLGEADSFDAVVFAFTVEDYDVGEHRLASAIETDEMTGVYTKQAFAHYAKALLEDHPGTDYCMVISDIEDFKVTNSTYGEAMGDRVLVYLAKAFSSQKECILCGRYASDRFIMITTATEEGNDEYVIRDTLKRITDEAPVPYLNLKIGIYRNVDRSDTIAVMCDKAMLALKSIKHNYEKSFAIYDSGIMHAYYRTQKLEADFERALAEREFAVWCQPQYSTGREIPVGGEALVRWRRQDGSYISPGEFIPVFERCGVIAELDEYVFRFVCERQKEQLNRGIRPLPVSVNMSRSTLFRTGTAKRYRAVVDHVGIPAELVPIELTETAASDSENIRALTNELKKLGFSIHMDDFGSGYSSLSNLSVLPFDVVKLDKSLIDDIGNANGDEILRHIIELSHFLHMEVVAEGVESVMQLQFLKKTLCDTIQGYYFSRPLPYGEYEQLVAEHTPAGQ